MHRKFLGSFPLQLILGCVLCSSVLFFWHGATRGFEKKQENVAIILKKISILNSSKNLEARGAFEKKPENELVGKWIVAASQRKVQMTQVSMRPDGEMQKGATRVALDVEAEYPDFKEWLSELLERYPLVDVNLVSMRSPAAGATARIRLILVLH